LSESVLESWRRAIEWIGGRRPRRTLAEMGPDARYLQSRLEARAGNLKRTEQRFAELVASAPSLAPAVEAHGEALDMIGQSALAAAKYDLARRLRSQTRRGAPDRCFALRNRRDAIEEIVAYTAVLRTGPDKRRPLTYVARGNAYLSMGYAKLALLDYGVALSLGPELHEVAALRGEAWAMLGNYPKALGAFDAALRARPRDSEILGGRAIVHMAMGRLEAADADWRRQLDVLPHEQAAARACVALRLADYATALSALQDAVQKAPNDPYWRLYQLTALRRCARTAEPFRCGAMVSAWPGPLLSLHAGSLSVGEALKQADNPGRRAEALFQAGVVAWPADPERARGLWREVVDRAPPSMIEHAAARHELARSAG